MVSQPLQAANAVSPVVKPLSGGGVLSAPLPAPLQPASLNSTIRLEAQAVMPSPAILPQAAAEPAGKSVEAASEVLTESLKAEAASPNLQAYEASLGVFDGGLKRAAAAASAVPGAESTPASGLSPASPPKPIDPPLHRSPKVTKISEHQDSFALIGGRFVAGFRRGDRSWPEYHKEGRPWTTSLEIYDLARKKVVSRVDFTESNDRDVVRTDGEFGQNEPSLLLTPTSHRTNKTVSWLDPAANPIPMPEGPRWREITAPTFEKTYGKSVTTFSKAWPSSRLGLIAFSLNESYTPKNNHEEAVHILDLNGAPVARLPQTGLSKTPALKLRGLFWRMEDKLTGADYQTRAVVFSNDPALKEPVVMTVTYRVVPGTAKGTYIYRRYSAKTWALLSESTEDRFAPAAGAAVDGAFSANLSRHLKLENGHSISFTNGEVERTTIRETLAWNSPLQRIHGTEDLMAGVAIQNDVLKILHADGRLAGAIWSAFRNVSDRRFAVSPSFKDVIVTSSYEQEKDSELFRVIRLNRRDPSHSVIVGDFELKGRSSRYQITPNGKTLIRQVGNEVFTVNLGVFQRNDAFRADSSKSFQQTRKENQPETLPEKKFKIVAYYLAKELTEGLSQAEINDLDAQLRYFLGKDVYIPPVVQVLIEDAARDLIEAFEKRGAAGRDLAAVTESAQRIVNMTPLMDDTVTFAYLMGSVIALGAAIGGVLMIPSLLWGGLGLAAAVGVHAASKILLRAAANGARWTWLRVLLGVFLKFTSWGLSVYGLGSILRLLAGMLF